MTIERCIECDNPTNDSRYVGDDGPFCETCFEWKGMVAEHKAVVEKLEAEVAQLKAHTWEQEREAIVCFTMARLSSVNIGDLQFFRKLVNEILCSIAQGEHWPKGKYGDSLVGSKTYRRPIEETSVEGPVEEIRFWNLPKEEHLNDE